MTSDTKCQELGDEIPEEVMDSRNISTVLIKEMTSFTVEEKMVKRPQKERMCSEAHT